MTFTKYGTLELIDCRLSNLRRAVNYDIFLSFCLVLHSVDTLLLQADPSVEFQMDGGMVNLMASLLFECIT